MYTSVKIKKRQTLDGIITKYAIITVFCGIFSFVYERFSHGVYSNYMVFLFLFPFFGGVLPFGILKIVNGIARLNLRSIDLYNAGIATLTVGSAFKGVLEIYGTTSGYTAVYWISGALLILAGIISHWRAKYRSV